MKTLRAIKERISNLRQEANELLLKMEDTEDLTEYKKLARKRHRLHGEINGLEWVISKY